MFKPYKYSKSTEYSPYAEPATPKSHRFRFSLSFPTIALKTLVSTVLIIGGLYVMFTKVFIPVVDTYANSGDIAPIISPIAEDSTSTLSLKEEEPFKFEELDASFREISNVPFAEGVEDSEEVDEKVEEENEDPEQEYFYLSIPKLEIEDAKVEINSPTLDPKYALGHYKGTCLPNEACNSFIYGHSTYKGTRNRYKQGDYTAIFSRLDELEYGDEFIVKYKDKEYHYLVELSKVDRPENVDPLESPLPRSLGKHESTMQLFTCTPAGTTKFRLSVIGRLVDVK